MNLFTNINNAEILEALLRLDGSIDYEMGIKMSPSHILFDIEDQKKQSFIECICAVWEDKGITYYDTISLELDHANITNKSDKGLRVSYKGCAGIDDIANKIIKTIRKRYDIKSVF